MKKSITLLFLVFVLTLHVIAQKNTLIMVHPTEYNLKLFIYLIDHEIINIDNLKITGVYHKNETYDYTRSKLFLEQNNYPFINLIKVSEEISLESLYQENNCTEAYTYLFKNSKGIIFLGGPDLPPAMYGEQMNLLTRMTDPYRHYFEASFLFHLLGGSQSPEFTPLLEENIQYTVYGICLGMQTMNIATGGTMTQDIPFEIYNLKYVEEVLNTNNNNQHRNYNKNLSVDSTLFSGNFHQIKISNQNPIVGNYTNNPEPLIYSNHHQAIEKPSKNLTVLATSMDGKVIEAIGHINYPNVLGIQFHPEGTYLHNPEIKYRKVSSDTLISGKQILLNNESYQFHLELWKTFAKKIK